MHALKKITLILAVGAAAVALASPALAICSAAITYGQIDAVCSTGPLGYCYVVSPTGHLRDTIDSSYWALGFGDPAALSGDDNGTLQDSDAGAGNPAGWLRDYGIGTYLTGTWADDGRIDGCIDGKIATGKTAEVMVVGFSDADNAGSTGYFAAVATSRVPGNATQFDFANDVGTDVNLVAIPAPSVTGSTKVSNTERQVTLAPVARPDAGFYAGNGVSASDVIAGIRLYKNEQAFSNPPAGGPTTRDAAAWTAVGGTLAFGAPNTVNLTCSSDVNIYLAYTIVFDSGFETAKVSANGLPVACGPNLADPGNRQFKLIDRKDRQLRPNQQRER